MRKTILNKSGKAVLLISAIAVSLAMVRPRTAHTAAEVHPAADPDGHPDPDADGHADPDADGDPSPDADGDPVPDADGDPSPAWRHRR